VIHLHSDCLTVRDAAGAAVPCSVESVMVELIGEARMQVDPEWVAHAASAVLHYFKCELGRDAISVGEFSLALERVLRHLGIPINVPETPAPVSGLIEIDLLELSGQVGEGMELALFQVVHEELRRQLKAAPRGILFKELRPCVQRVLSARRWNRQCQALNDQLIEYMRSCLAREVGVHSCCVVVQ
jgi:hypothetical protein